MANGVPGFSSGDVARDKLIIETDLKLLAKWHAKKYGDKLDLTSGGEKLPQPILQLNAVVVKPQLLNNELPKLPEGL